MPNTDITAEPLTELHTLLNVGDEQGAQVAAWLRSAFVPGRTRPALLLTGEQSSGKTTAAKVLQHLLDPDAQLRHQLPDEDEWVTVVDGTQVVAFDDIARLTPGQSDALCAVVTGSVVLTRGLYEAEEPTPPTAPALILAGAITPADLRPDLAARVLVMELAPLAEPRPMSDLWAAYSQARPRILAALGQAS